MITVGYLALQVRFAKKSLQADGSEKAMRNYSAWRTTLLANSDLADALAKANQDEELTDKQRVQLEVLADELFWAAALSYARSSQSGALHDLDADADYTVALFDSNPCLIGQWRRFRPFVDTIAVDYGAAVDARLVAMDAAR